MRLGTGLVISAPSGAGKSTLCKKLIHEFPNIHYSVSCTTRPKRKNEIEGKDYFFISVGEFEARRNAYEFAEWAEVHGNLYGTPIGPVKAQLAKGKDVLFDVDVQGAAQIKLALPDTGFVFILPPTMRELESRLRKRESDDEASISKRLANAHAEIEEARWYDALVINDDLDKAYDQLRAFYLARTLAPALSHEFLNRLVREEI